MVWPESACNLNLGRTFRGIERHQSDRLINQAEKKGAQVFRRRNLCSVEQAGYRQVKELLHNIVTKRGFRKDDLVHARAFLETIVDSAEGRV
jgi:hypothetical protein